MATIGEAIDAKVEEYKQLYAEMKDEHPNAHKLILSEVIATRFRAQKVEEELTHYFNILILQDEEDVKSLD